MVKSNKYYKSHTVGVRSEVGLSTDQYLAESSCLRNMMSFIPPRYRMPRVTNHNTTEQHEINSNSGLSNLLRVNAFRKDLSPFVLPPSVDDQ